MSLASTAGARRVAGSRGRENRGVRTMLTAAAMTYLAATIAAVAQLLFWLWRPVEACGGSASSAGAGSREPEGRAADPSGNGARALAGGVLVVAGNADIIDGRGGSPPPKTWTWIPRCP